MSETTTTTPIYLDADDYDALELSALAFGGIGAVTWFRAMTDGTFGPNCVHGHALNLELQISQSPFLAGYCRPSPFCDRLTAAGLTVDLNDRLVQSGERLSWSEYTTRLNIIRRDASAPAARRAH